MNFDMKKYLFRDEVFYVEKHPETYFLWAYITIYIERKGFWKFLLKYKKVFCSGAIFGGDFESKSYLVNCLEKAHAKAFPKNFEEIIQCSPEIEALYKK